MLGQRDVIALGAVLLPSRRTVVHLAAAATIAVAASVGAALTRADGPDDDPEWRMIGHDVSNTRSQPFETRIGRRNAARLAPRWVHETMGDVSATPAVGEDDDDRNGREGDRHGPVRDRGRRGAAVYFPDWGGRLWKMDAGTAGAVVDGGFRTQRHPGLPVAHESGRSRTAWSMSPI